MDLETFLATVKKSSHTDWNEMEVQNVYGWEYGTKGDSPYIEPKTFHKLAVYKPDIDISLVMTAKVNEEFQEPWVERFPNSQASSVAVHLRYRGAVVFEWVGVVVDGGRHLLPMPKTDGKVYHFEKDGLALARLFFDLNAPYNGKGEMEETLKRTGLPIV